MSHIEGARRAPSRRALVAGIAAAMPVAALAPSLPAQAMGTPHELFDLWRAYVVASRELDQAGAVADAKETAAIEDYPTPPNLIRVVKRDKAGAITDEWAMSEREIWEWVTLLPEREETALRERRLAALRSWKAACEAVDERHGVPAAYAAVDAAAARYKRLAAALEAAPATDLLGLQVKLAYLARDPEAHDAQVARTACADAARLTGLNLAGLAWGGAA